MRAYSRQRERRLSVAAGWAPARLADHRLAAPQRLSLEHDGLLNREPQVPPTLKNHPGKHPSTLQNSAFVRVLRDAFLAPH